MHVEWPGAVSRKINLTWEEVGWQGLYLLLNKAIVNIN